MAQPHFVFVHGAWQGGWCFDLLRLELNRRAVRTVAIDLPAMGDDETPVAEATFEDGVQRIVDAVGDHKRVVLVGHSFGGMYVTEAALRLPVPPKRLIYIAAYVPIPGDSFESLSEMAPLHSDLRAGMKKDAEGHSMEIDIDTAQQFFYADVEPNIAAAARARIKPQPLEPFRSAHVQEGSLSRTRLKAILAEDDGVLDFDGCITMCDRASVPFETVLSGHSPFLSMPKKVADLLLEARS